MTSMLWFFNAEYMQGICVLEAEPNSLSHLDILSQLFYLFSVLFEPLEVLLKVLMTCLWFFQTLARSWRNCDAGKLREVRWREQTIGVEADVLWEKWYLVRKYHGGSVLGEPSCL